MKRPLPLSTLLLAAVAVLLHAVPGTFHALAYDRAAVGRGQWHRLLSCHLVHASASHLFWNVAALLALGALAEPRLGRRRSPALLAATAALLGLLVHFAQPSLDIYCGLSGLVSAMLGALLLALGREARADGDGRRLALCAAALLLFSGKVAYEVVTGRLLFAVTAGFVAVPAAHLAGLFIGAAFTAPISQA